MEIDKEVTLADRILFAGDQKYPVISDVITPLGIMGYIDQCVLVGNVLKCTVWAFDRNRDRIPDQFAVFSRDEFIALSGSRGERYDVAKALASSKAVKSGFFFTVELGEHCDFQQYAEIQMVALFAESHYAHLVGTARANSSPS